MQGFDGNCRLETGLPIKELIIKERDLPVTANLAPSELDAEGLNENEYGLLTVTAGGKRWYCDFRKTKGVPYPLAAKKYEGKLAIKELEKVNDTIMLEPVIGKGEKKVMEVSSPTIDRVIFKVIDYDRERMVVEVSSE